MNKSRLLGAACASVFSLISISSHAAFIGRLPTTLGGTDYQAYYDDQLDITWTANSNINGYMNWAEADNWAASLTIEGVDGWRLPNMDVNGDDAVIDCSSRSQAACKDNEYGHIYYYGAGTIRGNGVTAANQEPFRNIRMDYYWSSTDSTPYRVDVWAFNFSQGEQAYGQRAYSIFAWAVHDGDVAPVPIPAAAWLFGSGLLGLIGIARKQKMAMDDQHE